MLTACSWGRRVATSMGEGADLPLDDGGFSECLCECVLTMA